MLNFVKNIMGTGFKLSIILIVWLGFLLVQPALADDQSYKQVFSYIKQSQWEAAENLASRIGDKALLKIVLSQEFLDKNYPKTSFKKITGFLKGNPKWPQHDLLKIRAEELIDGSTDKIRIYNWFKKHPAVTGNGHKYYALAAAEVARDAPDLGRIVRHGWIYGCFGKEEQVSYYHRFKEFIGKDDTIRRIDNLLWKGSVTSAKNSLNLVAPGYRRAFEAHMAFADASKDAEKLFRAVPKEYYTPGLVYQYLSSQKSGLPASREIVSLINSIKHYKEHPDDFWKLQSYFTREYIEHKHFNDAYLVASSHFASGSSAVSEAEFLSGWLALRFLNKPEPAAVHFKRFNEAVKTPMSVSRGIYWLGRAYEAQGKLEQAKKLYQQAAGKFGYTFYGQVATMELGLKKLRLPPRASTANHQNHDYLKNNDILKASILVSKYGNNGLAQTYLNGLIHSTKDKNEILAIAGAMQNTKLHHKVWMSKNAIQKHVFLDHYSYPAPYKIGHLPIEAAFTYSILRQESVFDQFAISSANAIGLMQLIKPTACETAKKIKVKCDVNNLMRDPHYNLKLGSHYLAEMLDQYKSSYILTIAAYNAGPGRIPKWINLYGDPRTFTDPRRVLDWIELIPFYETRNYVQRVLENLQIYRALLHNGSHFNLRQDLIGKINKKEIL